jgi:hypothetical protein
LKESGKEGIILKANDAAVWSSNVTFETQAFDRSAPYVWFDSSAHNHDPGYSKNSLLSLIPFSGYIFNFKTGDKLNENSTI